VGLSPTVPQYSTTNHKLQHTSSPRPELDHNIPRSVTIPQAEHNSLVGPSFIHIIPS
jgi:hypothetical protein